MDLENQYYENEDFWHNGSMSDRDMKRIYNTIKLIPEDVRTILDVGCGNGAFLNSLLLGERHFERLYGVDSSNIAIKYVKTEKCVASIDTLPFSNNEFDLVCSLEVIEHLPSAIYKKSLEELCRISSKFIIISTPYRENLVEDFVQCSECKSKFSHAHHKRTFDDQKMSELLSDFKFELKSIQFEGAYSEYFLFSPIYEFYKSVFTQELPAGIPCPVCGNVKMKTTNVPPSPNTTQGKVFFLKKFLPRKTKYRWVICLYEKV